MFGPRTANGDGTRGHRASDGPARRIRRERNRVRREGDEREIHGVVREDVRSPIVAVELQLRIRERLVVREPARGERGKRDCMRREPQRRGAPPPREQRVRGDDHRRIDEGAFVREEREYEQRERKPVGGGVALAVLRVGDDRKQRREEEQRRQHVRQRRNVGHRVKVRARHAEDDRRDGADRGRFVTRATSVYMTASDERCTARLTERHAAALRPNACHSAV